MVEETKASRIVFLLGAGASKAAGVPLTKDFVNEFLKDLKGGNLEVLATTIIDKLKQNKPNEVDVELLLEALTKIQDKGQETLLWFFEGGRFVLDDDADIETLVKKLKDFIKQKAIVASYSDVQYLEPLLGFLAEQTPLDIISLNYDTAIEQACNFFKRTYQDGFTVSWNPKAFSEEGTDVRIYKVHGSVMWYETDRGDYVKVPIMAQEGELRLITGERAENLMLYPIQKVPYVEPLLELLVRVKRLIEYPGCDYLIVVGYSFRDDHMRQIVWDAARRNRNLTLLIIDPTARKIYEDKLKYHKDGVTPSPLQERVICLPYRFEKYFPLLRTPELTGLSAGLSLLSTERRKKTLGQPTDFSQLCFHLAEAEHVDLLLDTLNEEGDRIYQKYYSYGIDIPSRAVFTLLANGRPAEAADLLKVFSGRLTVILGALLYVEVTRDSGLKLRVTSQEGPDPSRRSMIENIIGNVSRANEFIDTRISSMLNVPPEVKGFQEFMHALSAHLDELVGTIPLAAFVEKRRHLLPLVGKDFQRVLQTDVSTSPQIDLKRIEAACLELERHRLADFLQRASALLSRIAK